jgi:hypothetical protein
VLRYIEIWFLNVLFYSTNILNVKISDGNLWRKEATSDSGFTTSTEVKKILSR